MVLSEMKLAHSTSAREAVTEKIVKGTGVHRLLRSTRAEIPTQNRKLINGSILIGFMMFIENSCQ